MKFALGALLAAGMLSGCCAKFPLQAMTPWCGAGDRLQREREREEYVEQREASLNRYFCEMPAAEQITLRTRAGGTAEGFPYQILGKQREVLKTGTTAADGRIGFTYGEACAAGAVSIVPDWDRLAPDNSARPVNP